MTAAGVRPSERPIVVLVAAAFAILEVGRGIGEVGANTLVVGRLGPAALPYLFIPLGLVSLVASLAYGAALGRVRRGPLFAAILIGVAIALIAERAAIAVAPDVAIPLTWLTVVAGGAIAVTIAWTTATSTFDARQAKRLFPLGTAAAIAGNFVGALAAGPIAGLVGTESLIVGEAVLLKDPPVPATTDQARPASRLTRFQAARTSRASWTADRDSLVAATTPVVDNPGEFSSAS